ncbi:Sas10 C-terminal domain-containing protein [Exophiala viscosa]|uniref:Sas10 C-terminal domain-containing protein n=1 Tax=Exophiala viscosa TaxID=2486360 RepID=A0AAN6IC11_9EURO|nr:Sas10 C-terminal domain-containing protein [Exophiala viscosa]
MAKKRKAGRHSGQSAPAQEKERYDIEERFDGSEDEFFAGREKILLDEAPAAKRRRRLEEQEKDLQPSDEEVYEDLQTEDDEDEDFDAGEDVQDEEEEEEEGAENWGTSKADYYNADVIETEADALGEETEARRLQQKQLKAMTEADFGFDESAWVGEMQKTQDKRAAVEKLPGLQVPENATAEERLQMLRSRYPEFEPLTKDFVSLQDEYRTLQKEIAVEGRSGQRTVASTKFRALSSYLGAIAMYLAVLTSSKTGMALAPAELREHPVMNNLVQCRQLWQDAQALRAIEVPVPEEQAKPVVEEVKLPEEPVRSAPAEKKKTKKRKLEPTLPEEPPMEEPAITKRSRKPKRNDLEELLHASLQGPAEDESDFGDEAPLTQEEAAEKARKKKSLRFYTSQIAQKANKRGAASRDAGGDDDLPHKERYRERSDRLMREAEARGRTAAQGQEALGGDDDGDSAGGGDHDGANEYYDMLVANKNQKKADKQARAEAYAEAAKQGAQVYEEEQIGTDGKRKITYAIEKNKGLAPKRKKDVRNPRVKKRKKYDEKMKKLGSMRQVYKGGEGRGGYGGEATGIKTNVVKSIKL